MQQLSPQQQGPLARWMLQLVQRCSTQHVASCSLTVLQRVTALLLMQLHQQRQAAAAPLLLMLPLAAALQLLLRQLPPRTSRLITPSNSSSNRAPGAAAAARPAAAVAAGVCCALASPCRGQGALQVTPLLPLLPQPSRSHLLAATAQPCSTHSSITSSSQAVQVKYVLRHLQLLVPLLLVQAAAGLTASALGRPLLLLSCQQRLATQQWRPSQQ